MNNLMIKQVNFQGDNLIAAKDKSTGKVYTGISYICRGIGLTRKQKDRQVANIQVDQVLKNGCLKFDAGVFDPNNSTVAIDIDFLPLWLAKISITPKMQQEQPEIVQKLIRYQLKAKDVLAAAFINKTKQYNLPITYPEALRRLADKVEENEKLQFENKQKNQVIGELKPKADYTDFILKNPGLVTITQIAKDYGISGQKMNEILHNLKVQYKQSKQWLLYSQHQGKGYTHSQTTDIVHRDGRPDIKMNTKWTQKGRMFIYKLLKENGIVPVIEKNSSEEVAM